MTTSYTFEIPERPVPKGRPRVGRNGRVYTPKKTRRYEKAVARYAQQQGVQVIEGDVELTVDLYFKDRRYGDISNYVKAIEDGLNGVAYEDDKQICSIVAARFVDDREGAMVRVSEVEE